MSRDITPTAPGAAAQTCLDRPATVVGTGPTVTGTTGDDVIVTGTALIVEALDGDDLVCVSAGETPVVLTIDAGRGDDQVVVEPADVVAAGSSFDAGPGRDQLGAAQMEGRLAVNLRRDRWLLDDRSATVTGLEDVTLVAPSVRVLGDDGPSRMHGGSGADRLVDSHGPATLHGGPGRDTLLGRGDGDQLDGGRGHDNLVGGPGRDRADGGSGRDRCRAERRTSCER